MSETLNAEERRVLGVLLEKSLTHPQYYPMSINAIVSGCCQKSNRDPVMDLDEDAVWNALERLRAAGLVSRLMPGGASRVDRFKHCVKDMLGWEKPQWAVMAELLLRGPQTAGELRGRCARMYPFDGVEAVTGVLGVLSESEPPRTAMLPREPGQSASRYTHLLYPEDERPQAIVTGARAAEVTARVEAPLSPAGASAADQLREVMDEMGDLRGQIDDLSQQLEELRRRVESLES